MRIASFRASEGGVRLGVARDGEMVDLAHAAATLNAPEAREAPDILRDMLALITSGPQALERVRQLAQRAPDESAIKLSGAQLLAPIPRPSKNILCVGRNYAEHAAESLRAAGEQAPVGQQRPNIFTKAVTTVIGPHDDIPLDASVTQKLDWEVELAVVIGSAGRHIRREDALSHVFGYTVLNDLSARDLQHAPGLQWFTGKSLDGSCPMGPWIVTADEIPDPTTLHLTLTVNGAIKQADTTAHMIFDVPTIIASLSEVMTLEPGDIIATGTPAGVGHARVPQEYLKPGDVMETAIDAIGALRNNVVAVERQS
ncbi:MAG TPA: fumarylacetoacetate hydrolase family protein [Ktedonobacterales bacterium]|jgi:2-keto-4-pentenoate hydratase/2-oxohepta-3-ene-1,7-dioic acid hydratase in catechol pathway|nr:fumarylacetoacetate hydrolase family protein [Ktedonobacterales bacterium]